jgi:anti-sigma-K factor RskA
MIDEEKQDLATEYVFGSLDARASGAFEAELQTNAELRTLVDDLRAAAGAFAHAASPVALPPGLREIVLAGVRGVAGLPMAAETAVRPEPARSSGLGFLPWAVAAAFAVTAGALWMERDALRAELGPLRKEVVDLRNREVLQSIKIATLTAQKDATEAFARGSAVVVWDPQRQEGVIKLSGIPRAEPGKDYQLWIIDPRYPKPVSGGVVPVGADGLARVSFSPERSVRSADKFAVSIEKEGGVPEGSGPIVLLGN